MKAKDLLRERLVFIAVFLIWSFQRDLAMPEELLIKSLVPLPKACSTTCGLPVACIVSA